MNKRYRASSVPLFCFRLRQNTAAAKKQRDFERKFSADEREAYNGTLSEETEIKKTKFKNGENR